MPPRAEPGNLRWDVWRDQSDLERFVIDELYKSSADVAAHHNTPHYKNYSAKIHDLAERTAVVLVAAQVAG